MLARLATALVAGLLATSAGAQTAIGPFTGTASDGFETQTAFSFDPCVIERVFSNQADLCTPTGANAHINSSWFFVCTVLANSGTFFYGSNNGPSEITFDTPVERFGAYFATNGGQPGIRAEFYDCLGNIIGFVSETLPVDDCNWYWRGWSAPAGQPFARIVLYSNHNPSLQGLLQIDDMEADFTASCFSDPGTKQCFGDGFDNICPCLNNNDGSGPRMNQAGCANSFTSAGCNLEGNGSSSISAGDLELCWTGATPGEPGIVFGGTMRVASPFGDGIRCCGGNVIRLETIFSDATGAGCTTVDIGLELGAFPGESWCFQYWYRDPGGPCGFGFNFSNAYKVIFTP